MYAETEKSVNRGQNVSILHALVKDIIEGKTFREELRPGLDFQKTSSMIRIYAERTVC